MRLLYLVMMLTTGCGLLGPDEERVLGMILLQRIGHDGPEEPLIEMPDTVAVATPFTVSIETDVGCRRSGDTEVATSGNTATITVYDFFTQLSGNVACAALIVPHQHLAHVTLNARGAGTVVVRGAEWAFPAPTEIEYEFAVWVE